MNRKREFHNNLTFPCNDCPDRENPSKCESCSAWNDFIISEPTTKSLRETPRSFWAFEKPITMDSNRIFQYKDTSVLHPYKRDFQKLFPEIVTELSDRQINIATLFQSTVADKPFKEIAGILKVSEKTVQRDIKVMVALMDKELKKKR